MKAVLFATILLAAGSAHAQLAPGPVLLQGTCLAQGVVLPTTNCVVVVQIPDNPDFDCVFFTNVKAVARIDLPVDAFLNPDGRDCVPRQSAGPTIQVAMSRPALTTGSVYYTATAQLRPPAGPFTRSSSTGVIEDVSFCRGFNLSVCPLRRLAQLTGEVPIPDPVCPAVCNDVQAGEFPEQ